MRKKILLLLSATIMTLSLVACGGGKSQAEGEKVGTTDRLTVAIWDTNQQAGIQSIIDDWSKESGIEAGIQVITWNEYWTLLEAGASGGTLPDIFWMHSNQAQKYMENDMLLDLTDKIKESEKLDLNNYYSDIVDLYASNEKQYAIPKDIDTIALWYNKTMFDEANLSYPDESWTWETLYETAKKLTKEDGSQYGYAANVGNNQDGYYNAIYAYGGSIISEDKKTSGYDDPNTIKAMEIFEKMQREGISPDLQILSENGTDVLLNSGKVAMITQGSWMVPAFKENEYTLENCDVAVLPKGPHGTRVSMYNGLGWAAAANGKNTEAAWSLIEHLGTEEAQLKQAELGVAMSAYQGTSGQWKNSEKKFNLQAHIDMLDATLIFRPYSRNTTAWEDMATEELKAAWSGKSTMEEACKNIATIMNEILDEE